GETEVSVGNGSLHVVNLDEEPLFRRGEVRSRALKSLLMALEHTHDRPRATVVVKGDTLKMHTQLGYHRAELKLNLAPLDDDGHFMIRFQEPTTTAIGSELRLLFLKTIMERLGMQVTITNNRYLKAKIDKDRGG